MSTAFEEISILQKSDHKPLFLMLSCPQCIHFFFSVSPHLLYYLMSKHFKLLTSQRNSVQVIFPRLALFMPRIVEPDPFLLNDLCLLKFGFSDYHHELELFVFFIHFITLLCIYHTKY